MSHFDLWEQIQQCLDQWPGVCIMQVYSHIAPSVGITDVEFWGSLVVTTGKRADQSFSKPAKAASHAVVPTDDNIGNGPMVGGAKVWKIPSKVAMKFGHPAVSWIHQWWCNTGQQFLTQPIQLQWVSFLQLYIDYQLCTGQGGPLLWDKRWFFGERLYLPDFHPGYVKRCKWFQMLLKHYWTQNGFEFRSRSIRPASGAICCWLVTTLLSWPQERLDRVDQIILGQNNGVLHKGVNVDAFVHVEVDNGWAVGSPNMGYAGFA